MAIKKHVKRVPEEAAERPVRDRILSAAFSTFTERGFAEASTLEIATRARASKRELYALFGNKQDMLIACISERARRLRLPVDLPELRDREALRTTLAAFGARLVGEVSEPAVVAMFRLAIAEASRTPDIAQSLNDIAIAASRDSLREIMRRAESAGLLGGEPAEMAAQFFGLLWGNLMPGLLLGIAERPHRREIDRRAEAATAAFLRAYPEPA
ncbi:MAG TPA: TetR/AcrR family transcriptional regulator [Bradyrhizobium sp.]|nr:TetR/AcrR family transcriptional regulator [Bradyrhizobium sp.]